MTIQFCNPSMVNDYINHYSARSLNWASFWKVLQLDFGPEFLKKNYGTIKTKYQFKLELQQERGVRYACI